MTLALAHCWIPRNMGLLMNPQFRSHWQQEWTLFVFQGINCLAGITATLLHYLKDEAAREIPIWRMMSLTSHQLKVRAEAWHEALGAGNVVKSESTIGGGSLPEESISTFVLSLEVKSPDRFLKKLRQSNPPIIARVENDKILFDPRTVLQDDLLLSGLKKVLDD